MAIKKIFSGEKCTAKQWATDMLWQDLDNITDYYYDRWDCVYRLMTEKEKLEVNRQIDIWHNRIEKILKRAMK